MHVCVFDISVCLSRQLNEIYKGHDVVPKKNDIKSVCVAPMPKVVVGLILLANERTSIVSA